MYVKLFALQVGRVLYGDNFEISYLTLRSCQCAIVLPDISSEFVCNVAPETRRFHRLATIHLLPEKWQGSSHNI